VTREARRAGLALGALALAALAIAWGAGWLDALGRRLGERQESAARDAIVAEVFAPVFEDPAFQARATGMGDPEQQLLLFELARDGLARLPDETLLERLALLRDVAQHGDERTCATVLLGGAPGAADDLLAALDEATLRRWLALSRASVLATLRGDPRRPLAPDDAERARAALFGALGPDDSERFEGALQSLAGLSQRDACDLVRATLGAAAELPPHDRQLVARLFASG
jgi:hypothetical protein